MGDGVSDKRVDPGQRQWCIGHLFGAPTLGLSGAGAQEGERGVEEKWGPGGGAEKGHTQPPTAKALLIGEDRDVSFPQILPLGGLRSASSTPIVRTEK